MESTKLIQTILLEAYRLEPMWNQLNRIESVRGKSLNAAIKIRRSIQKGRWQSGPNQPFIDLKKFSPRFFFFFLLIYEMPSFI